MNRSILCVAFILALGPSAFASPGSCRVALVADRYDADFGDLLSDWLERAISRESGGYTVSRLPSVAAAAAAGFAYVLEVLPPVGAYVAYEFRNVESTQVLYRGSTDLSYYGGQYRAMAHFLSNDVARGARGALTDCQR